MRKGRRMGEIERGRGREEGERRELDGKTQERGRGEDR